MRKCKKIFELNYLWKLNHSNLYARNTKKMTLICNYGSYKHQEKNE